MSTNTTKEKTPSITLLNVRLSYAKLERPEAVKAEPDGKKRYGTVIMIPKSDKATHAKVVEAIEGIKAANKTVKFKSKDICLKDGDTDEDAEETYKGHWFLSANRAESQKAPRILDRKKQDIRPGDNQFPYSGCWANVVIGIYRPKGWDKICASLEVVQFAKDDTPFGGVAASIDDLPEIEDADDEDDGLGDG